MTTHYISITDTAKLLRRALAESFPGTKFSVRSHVYSGGASIRVNWIDGPAPEQAQHIVRPFTGAQFDATQDLKTYNSAILDGRLTRFGADFIFCRRDRSDAPASDMKPRPSATLGRFGGPQDEPARKRAPAAVGFVACALS